MVGCHPEESLNCSPLQLGCLKRATKNIFPIIPTERLCRIVEPLSLPTLNSCNCMRDQCFLLHPTCDDRRVHPTACAVPAQAVRDARWPRGPTDVINTVGG